MSKNTVKAALTSKRAKRVVENSQFDAFARRILRAYGRRIAAGDVEALRSLVDLSAEVDAVTKLAVAGLKEFGYSWAELADRLGVSRQAAQMRYGDKSGRGALDRRLAEAGQMVTLDTLVVVFAEHCRGVPATSVCPGCGYRFDPDDSTGDCPTNTVVRPLLQRRKHERIAALEPLTVTQMAELEVKPKAKPAARTSGPAPVSGELFDASQYRRQPGRDLDPVPQRRGSRRTGVAS